MISGVVPVAGAGSRLATLSRRARLPKCLTPVLGRLLIEYPLENLVSLGISHITIVLGPEPEFNLVREYLGTGSDWGAKFTFVTQHRRIGLGDAILQARDVVADDFALALGDDITSAANLASGLKAFQNSTAELMQLFTQELDPDALRRSCELVLYEGGRIAKIIEKPKLPVGKFRGIGLYFLRASIFDKLTESAQQTPNSSGDFALVVSQIAEAGKALGHEIDGFNFNINTRTDLLSAAERLLQDYRQGNSVD